MKYTATDSTLTLECDESEQAELREMLAEKGEFSEMNEIDFCERLTCNSELEWVRPEECGDLTDAPMLGILGQDTSDNLRSEYPHPVHGWRHCGHWDGQAQYQPILSRWGYMQYETKSFLSDLMETGKAVFVSSN